MHAYSGLLKVGSSYAWFTHASLGMANEKKKYVGVAQHEKLEILYQLLSHSWN